MTKKISLRAVYHVDTLVGKFYKKLSCLFPLVSGSEPHPPVFSLLYISFLSS